jgi:hypothetical protein
VLDLLEEVLDVEQVVLASIRAGDGVLAFGLVEGPKGLQIPE